MILLPLTFSNFLDSNNPSILWSLRFLLPKASASAFYCFQICKKFGWQFKILAILYLYCFIIIFSLTLQKVVLVIELNKVRNFKLNIYHLFATALVLIHSWCQKKKKRKKGLFWCDLYLLQEQLMVLIKA